ncbi:MAG: PIG-L family deacetylase [Clostridia bacterium]|nr:PIG-L family deacetylase [Clostridia bacterium]
MKKISKILYCLCIIVFLFTCLSRVPQSFAEASLEETVMIVAPHPDDETLMFAGMIEHAKNAGKKVVVVIIANGDYWGSRHYDAYYRGTHFGHMRICESVDALRYLGLNVGLNLEADKDNVIFLGYGDSIPEKTVYDKSGQIFSTSNYNSNTKTYGLTSEDPITWPSIHKNGYPAAPFVEVKDYHSLVYGKSADYTRANLLGDIRDVITRFMPSHIYTTSHSDRLGDHAAADLFVTEAIKNIRNEMPQYAPRFYESIIHGGREARDTMWPKQEIRNPNGHHYSGYILEGDTLSTFSEPPCLNSHPELEWNEREVIEVPEDMRTIDLSVNRKFQAIQRYPSQTSVNNPKYMYSFTKQDEFFWVTYFDRYKVSGFIDGDFYYEGSYASLVKAGFKVELIGTGKTVYTNQKGYFEFNNIPLSEEGYLLRVSKANYLTMTKKVQVVRDCEISGRENPIKMWAGDMLIDGVQDNAINMNDIMQLLVYFNSTEGNSNYSRDADFDQNGAVNMSDLLIIVKHFNQTAEGYNKMSDGSKPD